MDIIFEVRALTLFLFVSSLDEFVFNTKYILQARDVKTKVPPFETKLVKGKHLLSARGL